jgi:hypothetical protein
VLSGTFLIYINVFMAIRPKKMLWFLLHVPEKVGMGEGNFFFLNSFICIFGDLFYDGNEISN